MALSGRKVLITGGSAGIGAATARALTSQGAHVAVLARDGERLRAIARETGARPIPADLRDPHAVPRAVEAAGDELGGLDALVNNAGSFRLGAVRDGRYADWQDMVELNILGLLTASQAAVPFLTRSGCGQLINISSMSGRQEPSAESGVYAGTKHAVRAISDGLRHELHGCGIRVTVLSPGMVLTNRGEYISDPQLREATARWHEEQALDPADVAAQVCYVLAAPPDVHLVEIALISARQTP
ncbi:SDR family oxidoreductase [Streptomyces alanosinicus]|uniref:Oxidoreductase n=1 Tax=Streptomyces alanosinicus TaxID=68171 RepID=A0A919D790_9ACTN|nr:SDR family oxidoreductase [Streptomyces alanosinicus]GHE10340.1 oxidoreductase [Streptomyces alanosinicus]